MGNLDIKLNFYPGKMRKEDLDLWYKDFYKRIDELQEKYPEANIEVQINSDF